MREKLLQETNEIKRLIYEPGNMTRYDIHACKALVEIEAKMWVVSLPEFGCSCYIPEGMYLRPEYLAEKLPRRHGLKWGDSDLEALCNGIAKIIPNCTA